MQVQIKQVEGSTLVGKADSNHWLIMDAKKIYKGTNAGSSPMEVVLIALGGCLGVTLVSLLSKKKASFETFQIKLNAERTEEYPHVFTQIDVKCIFYGKELNEKDLKWAIESADKKYCPVGAMLKQTAQIKYSWEVISS